MIFFDWRKIYRKTGGSSKRIILVIKALSMTGLPKNLYDPVYRYYYDDFSGKSFLLQASLLIANAFRYTPKEVAQYIALASFRSYAHYRITGDRTLDLLHSPVSEAIIKKNRLLSVEKGRIVFLYEKSQRRNINGT